MNVVVVSNRVARTGNGEPIAGGLAAALLPAVKSFGAVWVGSSGKLRPIGAKDSFANIEALGKGALATVDLPEEHYARYYEGFANSALWPALHSRLDLIRSTKEDYRSYRHVNAYMARALLRFCKPDASYWVQDYHFLTLGLELRKLGIQQPLGFFLHTPWPARSIIAALPQHRELVRAMLSYDLLGFQTDDDKQNFIEFLSTDLGFKIDNDTVRGDHGLCRLEAFPIGIDAEEFATQSAKSVTAPDVMRLAASIANEKLVIGVDRVDYSKGLTNRISAFERLLENQPELRRKVGLLQIAVPSREGIATYQQLQSELSALVGETNGRLGEVDWTPIRYLNKGFSQTTLAGFYRLARVGLVTPLHDGMNLVAKEYVAAQNPADPGVLVLSQFAGAAQELDAALLVNPHDIDGIAQTLAVALKMPLEERLVRWQSMMKTLRATSVHTWFSSFLDVLNASRAPLLAGDVPLAPSTGPGASPFERRPDGFRTRSEYRSV